MKKTTIRSGCAVCAAILVISSCWIPAFATELNGPGIGDTIAAEGQNGPGAGDAIAAEGQNGPGAGDAIAAEVEDERRHPGEETAGDGRNLMPARSDGAATVAESDAEDVHGEKAAPDEIADGSPGDSVDPDGASENHGGSAGVTGGENPAEGPGYLTGPGTVVED